MSVVQHTTQIEWPNGAGFTPCSEDYAIAMDEADIARDEWREVEDDFKHPDHAARYEAMCRAENKLLGLQHTGHQGRGIRYARGGR